MIYCFKPSDFVQTSAIWLPLSYPENLADIILNYDDATPGTGDKGITPEEKTLISKIIFDLHPQKVKLTDAAYKALPIFANYDIEFASNVRKLLKLKELPEEGLITLKTLCDGPFKNGQPIDVR